METKTEVSSLIGRYLLLKIGATTTKLLFLAKQQQQQEKKSKNFDVKIKQTGYFFFISKIGYICQK